MMKKNRKRSSAEEEDSVQIRVEPLDELLFDYDEIKVPVVVELWRKEAELLFRSHQMSACCDLKSLDKKRIPAGERVFFDLGLAFKIQRGWVLHIYNRSGLSLVQKIEIPGTPKIIDSNYCGNVFVCLENKRRKKKYTVKKRDRIAQMSIVRDYLIDFKLGRVNRNKTERGEGKLGSTGR